MKEHFDIEWLRLQEIKKERIEECLKHPELIGDLLDDIEIFKIEQRRRDYQFRKATKDLQRLDARVKTLEEENQKLMGELDKQ
tara:strand:+ start:1077 stop:1325 length:249 start_codon:yes stop_codon:yes gene_type:complete